MLENGEQAIAVEVKTTLRQSDIDDHLLRIEPSGDDVKFTKPEGEVKVW
jgi:hypothetical protein